MPTPNLAKLSLALAALSDGAEDPQAVLRPLGTFEISGRPDVALRVYYIPLQGRALDVVGLMSFLQGHFIQFCLSREEIDRELKACGNDERKRLAATQRLYARARNAFVRASSSGARSGECGELLLYVLLESVYKAPKLVSKMSLKTSAAMHVHGSDAIHVSYDELTGALIVYFGEAKFNARLSAGLSAAAASIESMTDVATREFEIDLIRRHALADLGRLSAAQRRYVLEHFNPYGGKRSNRQDVYAVLAGFDEQIPDLTGLMPKAADQRYRDHLRVLTTSKIVPAVESFAGRRELVNLTFEVLILPVESVDTLRSEFNKIL